MTFLIDKFWQLIAFIGYAATVILTAIVKNLPIAIMLTTIVCVVAVIYAAFEYAYLRSAPGSKPLRYRPGKISMILTVLGAAAVVYYGVGWKAAGSDSTPVFDYLGTQLTAAALLLMLSALVFNLGAVLFLRSETRD